MYQKTGNVRLQVPGRDLPRMTILVQPYIFLTKALVGLRMSLVYAYLFLPPF